MMFTPSIAVVSRDSEDAAPFFSMFTRLGASVLSGENTANIDLADGVVLCGSGSFVDLMSFLQSSRVAVLIERRLAGGRAILGIGTGMQIMFESAEIDGVVHEGLGEWPGMVTALTGFNPVYQGCFPVSPAPGSRLLAGIEGEEFYFSHSMACFTDTAQALGFPPDVSLCGESCSNAGLDISKSVPSDSSSYRAQFSDASDTAVSLRGIAANKHFRAPLVSWANHGVNGGNFVAAVENGALMATQFHPERSGAAGKKLLANWLASL